jgi:serine protease
MLSINPFLTPDQLTQLLENTARHFGAGKCDEGCGAGILDAGAAVRAAYGSRINSRLEMCSIKE